jgi:hypothetical protein
MRERIGNILGASLVGVGILIEGLEHVEFVWNHVPKRVADMLDQKAVFFLILLGFVILWLRRHHKPVPEGQPATGSASRTDAAITDSFKQSITGNKVDLHFHEIQSTSLLPTPSPVPEPIASIEPKPRLEVANPRVAAVGWDVLGVWREWHGDLEGVLLEVRSLAGETGEVVGTADNLVVGIAGESAIGSYPNLVSRAYWLGHDGNEIRLQPGDKCDVLLAVCNVDVLAFYENHKKHAPIYLGRRHLPRAAPHYEPTAHMPLQAGVRLCVKILDTDRGETLFAKTVYVEKIASSLVVRQE